MPLVTVAECQKKMLTQDIQLKPFFHPCTPGYVSLRSRCQWAPVQQRLCSASWTGVNRRNVEAVKLLDYQAAHSTAFDGLVCDYWHHYTDRVPSAHLQAHTLYGTAHGHSVKSLCSQRASHPRGMCVPVCMVRCVPLGSWVLKGKVKL